MKEWIKELCPEIEDWQADAIAEHVAEAIKSEREACARVCEEHAAEIHGYDKHEYAAAIRARGEK